MEAIGSHRWVDGKPESESQCLGLGQWLWGWRESRLRSEHHFGGEIDRTEIEGRPSGSSPVAPCQAPAPGIPARTGHTAPGVKPWPYDPVTLGSCQPLPPFPNCKPGPTVLEAGGWHTPSSLLRSFCPSPVLYFLPAPSSRVQELVADTGTCVVWLFQPPLTLLPLLDCSHPLPPEHP